MFDIDDNNVIGRSFIKSGQLAKITGKSKARVDYHFFLFSDLIIYASEGMQTKYKMHRVVHLSLCRLVDIRSASCMHIAITNTFLHIISYPASRVYDLNECVVYSIARI
jgi:hypothetical protein